jgi:16S rRNA (uracil1498-N3)-methyltransferase
MAFFFSRNISEDCSSLYLVDDDHIHCTKALRLSFGTPISVIDGRLSLYHCTIQDIERHRTFCKIHDISKYEPIPILRSIAIAPTKNAARLEWFIEKAVEIGIDTIYIFHSTRTERKTVNLSRIEKLMIAALKQSERVLLPEVKVLKNIKELEKETKYYDCKMIAHLDVGTVDMRSVEMAGKNSLLLIGPEGDFTPEEIDFFASRNYISVSLGNFRLRTETAALVGLTLMFGMSSDEY